MLWIHHASVVNIVIVAFSIYLSVSIIQLSLLLEES